MKRLLVAVLGIGTAFHALADWLPREDPVPGGVARVAIGPVRDAPPRVFLGTDRVMVVRQADTWLAIVGLPLTIKPGAHDLTVISAGDRTETRRFTVRTKEYGVQRITLKDKRMVDLSPADLERIEREQIDIKQIFTRWNDTAAPPLAFQFPTQGRLSGAFGTRRFFNDQERQPHNGLDIAAARGAAIAAPADGVITGIGDYFFNGRTVFIDHGQGLVSMYNHLDRVAVTLGEKVVRGQRIGDVGMTGRATGPHLHWAVSLNNTRVDPLLFVSGEAIKQLAQGNKASAP
jgi:murein DD-endopeptidase MepM/ murein hydrolase activator NlpD